MSVGNLLLDGLDPSIATRLEQRARRIEVQKGDVLQLSGQGLEAVFFPETAVLSVGAETFAGEGVEVALVGAEGVFGAFEACGTRQSYSRVSVHIPGRVLRLPAAAYRELFEASPALRHIIHKYVELLLVEARQLVACNALHTVETRLARALLDTYDRSGSSTLALTQDALAQVLGVQRTTIAAAMGGLQRDGLIRSGRGMIELIDVPGLERGACSCREILALARQEIRASAMPVCEA